MSEKTLSYNINQPEKGNIIWLWECNNNLSSYIMHLLHPCSTVWAKIMQNANHGLFGEKVIILPELYLYLIVYWSHNDKTSLKIRSCFSPISCWVLASYGSLDPGRVFSLTLSLSPLALVPWLLCPLSEKTHPHVGLGNISGMSVILQ